MKILVCAATPIEISPFLKQLHTGDFPKLELDVLVTGIGLTATTWSLSKQINLKRPDVIIQAGVGGCFDTSIPLGAVLAIKKEAIADQSVIELNKLKTLFDLKLVPQNQYPFTKGWLVNKNEILKKVRLKKVSGVTVNEITTSKQKVNFYKKTFKPVVESMEGAALHYVCLMENIPFIQLRSISNYIGERNKKKWDMQGSVKNLNDCLVDMIEKIN